MSQHVPTPGNCFGIVPFPFACALASRAAGKRSGGKYGAGAPLPAFFAFIKFPGVKLLWMADFAITPVATIQAECRASFYAGLSDAARHNRS